LKSNIFITVVIVEDKSLKQLESVLIPIQKELEINYSDYEIIIISQGTSRNFNEEDEHVLKNISSLRYIQLSSIVCYDVACAAGLENAIGDFVVIFNVDDDPVNAITETVNICRSGMDIVVGTAKQSRTIPYKIFRIIAGKILKLVDYSLPRDTTALRCLSRRAVNSVTSTGKYHHQLSMRIQKTGYQQAEYKYKIIKNGPVKYQRSLYSGFRDLLRLLVFNSYRPLRWMTGIGILGSVFAILFALFSLLAHIIKGRVVEGWTTTILFMSILFMMQFIMMAFFGEYIGRLLEDQGDQLNYSVVYEKCSMVMINQNRINVLSNSITNDINYVQTGRNC
jgi:polyisoprenyl-phosphate glycosyltransferase